MTGAVRWHRAWIVAFVAFVALIGAAGFRSAPGVLMVPLHDEFGWSRASMSIAVSVNLLLFGLASPFAAALMERFGIRRVVSVALVLITAGNGLTVFMTATWQLVLCWGVLVGLGTGSMTLVFAATVAQRWFVRRRGLVVGLLTAGSATGQLVFLPVLAHVVTNSGWRAGSVLVAVGAIAVVPLILGLLRERPKDVGLLPYGALPGSTAAEDHQPPRALRTLSASARSPAFWLLCGVFFVCGATTNGLVGTHFIPAAQDHGMPATTAADLLALVGVFDIAGTVASGWLTERFDSRWLLAGFFALRAASLVVLPQVLASDVSPGAMVFIVLFGLVWVADVPPTLMLARQAFGPVDGTVVFGWVFAAHQVGAATAAAAAGEAYTLLGTYTPIWYGAAGLCLAGVGMSLAIRIKTRPQIACIPAALTRVDTREHIVDSAGEQL